MGLFRKTMLALVGATCLAAPAAASDDDWPVLKGARVDEQAPLVAMAIYRPSGATFGLGIYRVGSGSESQLLARRVSADPGGATSITWTSSQACPQLAPALAELARVPAPRIEPPQPGAPPALGALMPDGSGYHLWVVDARWANVPAPAGMELRAVSGPLADWSERTVQALASCWRPERPQIP